MHAYYCSRRNRQQIHICLDLESAGSLYTIENILPRCDLVYSDPPWNPGNATYWRTHAKKPPCKDYSHFVDTWAKAVALGIKAGARHVFSEQSSHLAHRQVMLDAAAAHWPLPLLEEWTVFYGSPGSGSVRHPNHLLHYGITPLRTNPSDMAGEAMTIRVCAGVHLPAGSVIFDPCMGKGMTSRMAEYFDWDCVGTELNHARLQKTIEWLIKKGYSVEEKPL